MAYTVKKLADLSGVSVRTLHFYDEIGILAPAYIGEQGYRFYEEEQLMKLQQILFFRELDIELRDIQRILNQSDFDKVRALQTHRQALLLKGERMRTLIETVDKTIKQLSGEVKMNDNEIYRGFSPEKQAEHEEHLVNRYGDYAKDWIAQSKKNTAKWNKAKWEQMHADWDNLCEALSQAMANQEPVDAKVVQALVRRHYELIRQFWTPNHDAYIGLGQSYLDFNWKQAFEKFDPHHPKLAMYLAEAMKVFANNELS